MITLPGFTLHSEIFEGRYSRIFRAVRQEDDCPVVFKLLKKEYPSAEEIARFKREYRMTSSLELEGVVDVYSLEKYQNSLVIVMEDFGGDSLDMHLKPGEYLELDKFFDLSLRLASIPKDCIIEDLWIRKQQ